MIWGAMSSAGVGPLCFLKTNVTAHVYQYILEHFMLPSADQLFKDADIILQQDLVPAHTAKNTKSWLNDISRAMTKIEMADKNDRGKHLRNKRRLTPRLHRTSVYTGCDKATLENHLKCVNTS